MTTRAEAIGTMRQYLKPGDTAFTILRHVSASGMTREISVKALALTDAGKPCIVDITYLARAILGYRRGKHDGLRVGGCGQNMGFHIVYGLSRALFPDGFACTGDRCPSNDHSNRVESLHHADGGYALRHSWL